MDIVEFEEKNWERLQKEYRIYLKGVAEDKEFNVKNLVSYEEWVEDDFNTGE